LWRRGRARGQETLSWRTLSVRRRLVEELSGEARGCGAGRAQRGAGGEEGRDRGRHAGWSEGDSAGDLLQGEDRRRLGDQAGEGELGGRKARGRLGSLGQGDRDEEPAAVPVVPEALDAEFENPPRPPALELGLGRDLGVWDRDKAVGGVLAKPVVRGLTGGTGLLLLGRLLLVLLLLLGRLLQRLRSAEPSWGSRLSPNWVQILRLVRPLLLLRLLLLLRHRVLRLLLLQLGLPTAGAGLLGQRLLRLLLLGLAAEWLLQGGCQASFPLADPLLDRGLVGRGVLLWRGVGRGRGRTEVREIFVRPIGFPGVEPGGRARF